MGNTIAMATFPYSPLQTFLSLTGVWTARLALAEGDASYCLPLPEALEFGAGLAGVLGMPPTPPVAHSHTLLADGARPSIMPAGMSKVV